MKIKKFITITSREVVNFTCAVSALISLLLSLLLSTHAHAEKADSLKKTTISAGYSSYDGSALILKGKIEITRGTLLIQAENGSYKENEDGSALVTLTGTAKAPVFFKQKRDGGPDLWIEGVADKVEYDDKTEVVKLISKAKISYLNQKKVTQSQEGDFLSYDNIKNLATATNSETGKHIPDGGRISITIEPKPKKTDEK